MNYTSELEEMCCVAKGPKNGPAPIPQEGQWNQVRQITDIIGLTHGIGRCAPHQGGCKLPINIKEGIIAGGFFDSVGGTGMTHSAANASEILPGKTILTAFNIDLVCDANNVTRRELFNQIVYGRRQSTFADGELSVDEGSKYLGLDSRKDACSRTTS